MKLELMGVSAVLAAVAVESFAQVFLKIGAAGGRDLILPRYRRVVALFPFTAIAGSWVALGVIAYGLEILLYTFALHLLDVSMAFPMGSLCFVGVAILSKLFFGETVGRVRWLGVGCIVVGAVLVAM